MTKAVGDFLGTSGIADEMIRFNGFPFLEKEDHAYNVAGMAVCFIHPVTEVIICNIVSAVMRRDMHILTDSGMHVRDVGRFYPRESFGNLLLTSTTEAILANTNVKGFPIVSSDATRTLVGYIGRTELRYVLGVPPLLESSHQHSR